MRGQLNKLEEFYAVDVCFPLHKSLLPSIFEQVFLPLSHRYIHEELHMEKSHAKMHKENLAVNLSIEKWSLIYLLANSTLEISILHIKYSTFATCLLFASIS